MKKERKNLLLVVFALVIAIGITFIPIGGLEPMGRLYLGTTIGMLVLWFTNAVPAPVTFFIQLGLLTLLIPHVSDITAAASFPITMTNFSNASWALLACAFFLVAIVEKSGLARRIALIILNAVGPRPKRFVAGILFAGAFLNLFLPAAMSVSALLTGIVGGIVIDYKLDKSTSNLSKSIYLAVGVGTIAGNIFIQTAGAPAVTVTNIISNTFGVTLSYLDYMKLGLPLAILMDVFAFVLITRLFPSELEVLPGGGEYIKSKISELGAWTPDEIKTGIVLLLTIICWMTGTMTGLNTSTVALIAVAILLCPVIGVATFKDVAPKVPWGTLIFCGSSLGLASGLVDYGAAEWLVNTLVAATNLTSMPIIIVLVGGLIIMAICACMFTVRVSAVSAILPCAAMLGTAIATKNPGFSAMGFTMVCFYPLLFTVIIPIHTPYTLLPQAAGGFESKDMVKVMVPYVILTLISCVVLYFTYWRLIGLT